MKSLIYIVLILIPALGVAQIPDQFSNEKLAIQHKKEFDTKCKQIGLHAKPEYYYKKNININKYQELKSLGVDLKVMDLKTHGGFTYQEYSLMSNIVIKGKVIEKIYDADRESYFHTTVKVEVQEVVKGENLPKIINLKLRSGLIGENKYVKSSDEPEFEIDGETVFLFLSKVPYHEMVEQKEKGFFQHKIPENYKRLNDYYLEGKFVVKLDYVFDDLNNNVGKIQDITSSIQAIEKVNNSNQFYQRSYK
ncbi:hypothetical protein QQ008_07095 [Fulvivirgaceae bacterium BMA10]|uniref:Uncharacterized protein n=1 Tax=Splendidivirga corallicola TaxID=3051826 RepID=A0ABT8KLK8_9BACT|nr:hypothetical protein [Fulvivirgaceae bacterium BMA10]